MEPENRPQEPRTDLPAGYDARVVVVDDPLPLADLRSFLLAKHSRTHQARLTAGGGELVLASSRGRWLFLWIVDLERRVVAERVSLRSPENLRDFSIGEDGDRLWVLGPRGAFGISRRDWRILGWCPYWDRLPPPADFHSAVLIPGSSHLWVHIGDSTCLFDLASGRMDRRRDIVGYPRPLPTPGGPLVVVSDDDDRYRLYRPDGSAAADDELPVLQEMVSLAVVPSGRGLLQLALVERDDEPEGFDLRLRWLRPGVGTGYRVAAEHEMADVSELPWFHTLATSFDAGLCFVLADFGGDKTLHALSLTAGGFRQHYRLAVPYTSRLLQDAECWTAALLFSDERGMRVVPLGPEPPDRIPETLLSCPWVHYPDLDDRIARPRFSDWGTEEKFLHLYTKMLLAAEGPSRELVRLYESEDRDRPDDLVTVGYVLASLADLDWRHLGTKPGCRSAIEGLLARLSDELAEAHPRHPRAALFLARQEANAGRWPSVLRWLEVVREGDLDDHATSHFHHLSGLALLHEGRMDEAHAAFVRSADYEEAGRDIECLAQLVQPMSDPPAAAEWGPDQPLLRRLLGAIRTADRARRDGDAAAALAALDRAWVWEESEVQSFARFADLALELPASTAAERFDKRLVLAHFRKICRKPAAGCGFWRKIRLSGVSWDRARLDRIEERAVDWLVEEAGNPDELETWADRVLYADGLEDVFGSE